MLREFFKLDRPPFQNTPDPTFFFASRGHREALASMIYGIQEGKGFTVVTGDVGTGKTMLVQALKNELADRHILIEISNPWVSPEEVFNAVRLRIKAAPAENNALLDSVKKRLIALAKKGQRVVLIIDEAHQLPERTLEGIRLLSNIETNTEKLLQIILLGQDELASMLSLYSMRQVQQRIAMSFHLHRLNLQETSDYIQHRLQVAGGYTGLFSAECIELIYRESGGSPRLINQVCDNALLFAFGRRSPQVTPETVSDAIVSLHPERRQPDERSVEPNEIVPPVAAHSEAITRSLAGDAPRIESPADEALPFSLPGADVPRPQVTAPAISGHKLLFPVLALLAGLLAGAAGFAIFLKPGSNGAAITHPGGEARSNQNANTTDIPARNGTPPPALPQKPGSDNLSPDVRQGSTAATPAVPNFSPPRSMPPVSAARPAGASLPLPGTGEPGTVTISLREARIPPQGSMSLLASSEFGAWNESVRDLLAVSNPRLADFDALPASTLIQLPVLNREALVVKDQNGRFYVYFASFDSVEEARQNVEAIRRTWPNTLLVPASRHGVAIQRLFIGDFVNRSDALAVTSSLWFKHLPNLN